jgi:hypothetical protein
VIGTKPQFSPRPRVDLHEPGHLGLQVALSHLPDDHAVLVGRLLGGLVDEIVELVALFQLPMASRHIHMSIVLLIPTPSSSSL